MLDGLTATTPNSFSPQPPIEADDAENASTFAELHEKESDSPMTVGASVVHAALDVGECIPEIGHAFEAGNAALYLMQGHSGEAAICAAATFIPGDDQLTGAMQLAKVGAHVGVGAVGVGRAEYNKLQNGT